MQSVVKTSVAPVMVALPATLLINISSHVRELGDEIVEKERGGDISGAADVARKLGYIHGLMSMWVEHARGAIEYETRLKEEVELAAKAEAERVAKLVNGSPPFETGAHGVKDGSIERVVEGIDRMRSARAFSDSERARIEDSEDAGESSLASSADPLQ